MKSLFEESTFEEVIQRLNQLNENSKPLWGKMAVGQMVWHCQFPLKVGIENKIHNKKPNLIAKLFLKKMMYNDKAMRKNLPTLPILKAKEPKNFKEEIFILKKMVSEFYLLRTREKWNPHPVFGTFTKDQWGKMQFKHLDHHLRQFGV